ncbi:MAG: PEP-CTERM sorting domain-containing protein [Fuerstiella sp.]
MIDDFSGPGSTGSDAVRVIQPGTNAAASFTAAGIVLQGNAVLPIADPRSIEVNYSWAGGLEPFLGGLDRFLEFDVVGAQGDWEVQIAYRGLGGTGVDGQLTVAIANGTSGSVSVDLATGGNSGHLNGLQELDLTFVNLSADPGLGNRVLTLGNLAAVPEPASIALLGLTGLGGVVVARRRRKQQESA